MNDRAKKEVSLAVWVHGRQASGEKSVCLEQWSEDMAGRVALYGASIS